ncbi:DMT family transporter [Lutibacter sp. B2]|nr:DMT family transporter [Lutibacter sp. B2]
MKVTFNPKIAIIIAVLAVSFSSIFIKMSSAPALIVASYRLGITVLLMLPSIFLKNTDEIKSLDKKTFFTCMIGGVVLAAHFTTWVYAVKYTSIASAVVLVNTTPIFTVIATYILFKEKTTKKALLGIGIAFLGAVIISGGDYTLGSNIILGDALATVGALFFAIYLMIGRAIRQKISVSSYTFIVYSTCFITLFLGILILDIPLYPYPLREWMIFLALALVCTFLGHSMLNWALGYVSSTFVSTTILGEPVCSIIWAKLIFSENPTLWQIAGSIIILYGIYAYTRNTSES